MGLVQSPSARRSCGYSCEGGRGWRGEASVTIQNKWQGQAKQFVSLCLRRGDQGVWAATDDMTQRAQKVGGHDLRQWFRREPRMRDAYLVVWLQACGLTLCSLGIFHSPHTTRFTATTLSSTCVCVCMHNVTQTALCGLEVCACTHSVSQVHW